MTDTIADVLELGDTILHHNGGGRSAYDWKVLIFSGGLEYALTVFCEASTKARSNDRG